MNDNNSLTDSVQRLGSALLGAQEGFKRFYQVFSSVGVSLHDVVARLLAEGRTQEAQRIMLSDLYRMETRARFHAKTLREVQRRAFRKAIRRKRQR